MKFLDKIAPDNFLVVPNTHWNALYFHRKLLLEALLTMRPLVKGNLIDIGCGAQPYRSLFTHVTSYKGVDVASSCHNLPPDTILYDGESIPFPDSSFDWAMATEVLEHTRRPEILLSNIYNVLRPGGGLFLSVPFLAGLHETPNDYRRWTNYGLIYELEKAGFERIKVLPLGNWHSAAAHFLGTYVSQCKMPWWTKYWLSRLLWGIKNFIAGSNLQTPQNMCINWFAIAYKPPVAN